MVFRLLQALFSSPPDESGKFDAALIRGAIERVIAGTDPRLRMASQYQKKLWPAVEYSMEYVNNLVDSLPSPTTINSQRFTNDPHLRALFASSQHLQEILSFSEELHRYRQQISGGLPTDLYGLMRAERTEKTTFGVALDGNFIRRDVPQLTVSFRNQSLAFPSGSETKARREIKKRAFDHLIKTALDRLATARARKQELEHQQRQLFQQKTKALNGAKVGLQPLLDSKTTAATSPAMLDQRLQEIEAELSQLRADSATLDHHLAKVVATFSEPEKNLRLEQVTMTLDNMNVKVEDATNHLNQLTFNDIFLGKDRWITVLPIHFPSTELLPEQDFFEEANRLLCLGTQPRLTII